MRKVVQVAVAGVANTNATQADYITVALCDDGTVWELSGSDSAWRSCPSIPQEVKP